MLVSYDLMTADELMYGDTLFSRSVIVDAISRLKSLKMSATDAVYVLNICRYADEFPPQDWSGWDGYDQLVKAGCMLDVIGHVDRIWLEGATVKCTGFIEDGLRWKSPITDYRAIPYMLKESSSFKIRVVTSFQFTEVVLVYQDVTNLAKRKYRRLKK